MTFQEFVEYCNALAHIVDGALAEVSEDEPKTRFLSVGHVYNLLVCQGETSKGKTYTAEVHLTDGVVESVDINYGGKKSSLRYTPESEQMFVKM